MQTSERCQQGLIFIYAEKHVKDIRKCLKSACQKSDILYSRFEKNGFIFHDIRHTLPTNARNAGIHRKLEMAIIGDRVGDDMHLRFDTIDESDLLSIIDKFEKYIENVDHSVDQGLSLESSNIASN